MRRSSLALALLCTSVLSTGFRPSATEEPWESCHAPLLGDAEAIAKWEGDRTTNGWGPNWPGSPALPARSASTVYTQSGASLAHPGEPKYALSNSRAIALFDQYGRLRGLMDRARGVEYVRRDGTSTASPAYQEVGWTINYGPATSATATSGWGISTSPTPTITSFTDPLGGEGMRVVHVREGLTFTTDYWFDGNALMVLPKSITGTHTSGGGVQTVDYFLPGMMHYQQDTQDWYVPSINDGAEVVDFGDGTQGDGIYDAQLSGYGATSGWTANYIGFMIDRRFGLYLGVEDPDGYPLRGFTVRTLDQSNGFNVAFGWLASDWGEAGASWTNSAPIALRPFCSEAGAAAIAKHYRRFALQHDWSHPPLAMSERTDAIAASDIWGAINTGSSSDAAAIRDPGCTGSNCSDPTIDHYEDEFGDGCGVSGTDRCRFAFWYALWASEPGNLGAFNSPISQPKSNAATTMSTMLAAFPEFAPLPYFNTHSTDLSSLYATDNRCGKEGDSGDGINAGVFSSSHHADSYATTLLQSAAKWPHHEASGTCNTTNPGNCHHQGYFGSSGGNCLVESSAAYAPFHDLMIDQIETLISTMDPPGIYLDVAPQMSSARFDSSDTDKGYKTSSFDAARDYYADIAAEHADGVYAFTREHAPDYVNAQIPSQQNWQPVNFDSTKGNIQRFPLWSLVYHDWMAGNGLAIGLAESRAAYGLKLARALAFGYMPNVAYPVIDSLNASGESVDGPTDGNFETLVKRFSSARRKLDAFLVEGELIAPIEHSTSVASDLESWSAGSGGWCNAGPNGASCAQWAGAGAAPSIQGGWWRGSDGSEALVVANADPVSSSTAYVAPLPRYRLRTKQDCLWSETKGSCAASPGFAVESEDRWKVVVGAGQVRVIYLD